MNDDEFRTYLMMMATRGTAFWELHYSYDMMDEGQKWVINADVLRWISDNYEILRHAKLIGQTPAKGGPYRLEWAGRYYLCAQSVRPSPKVHTAARPDDWHARRIKRIIPHDCMDIP